MYEEYCRYCTPYEELKVACHFEELTNISCQNHHHSREHKLWSYLETLSSSNCNYNYHLNKQHRHIDQPVKVSIPIGKQYPFDSFEQPSRFIECKCCISCLCLEVQDQKSRNHYYSRDSRKHSVLSRYLFGSHCKVYQCCNHHREGKWKKMTNCEILYRSIRKKILHTRHKHVHIHKK